MQLTFYATLAVVAMSAVEASAEDITPKEYLMLAQSYQDFDLNLSEAMFAQVGEGEEIEDPEILSQMNAHKDHGIHKPKPMGHSQTKAKSGAKAKAGAKAGAKGKAMGKAGKGMPHMHGQMEMESGSESEDENFVGGNDMGMPHGHAQSDVIADLDADAEIDSEADADLDADLDLDCELEALSDDDDTLGLA